MRIFKKEPNFKLMGKRNVAFTISGIIIVIGIILFYTKGLNLGVDFKGGAKLEISFNEPRTEDDLRSTLKEVGFEKISIQRVKQEGNKFFIETPTALKETIEDPDEDQESEDSKLKNVSKQIRESLLSEEEKNLSKNKLDLNKSSEHQIRDFLATKGVSFEDASDSASKIIELITDTPSGLLKDFKEIENLNLKKRVTSILRENSFFGSFTFLSVVIVGPKVGHDLGQKATLAAIWAVLGMFLYIGLRFKKIIFGVAAAITLIHDVLICLSFILFLRIEFSLPVVAALLTVIGYSLNDTIVIFDRVRDNIKLMRRDNAEKILDRSINQTLSRTIVTSGTTLLTLLALFFLGGEVIQAFSLTLIIGIIVGTYSSVFQSCAWLNIFEKKFLGKKKF